MFVMFRISNAPLFVVGNGGVVAVRCRLCSWLNGGRRAEGQPRQDIALPGIRACEPVKPPPPG